MSPSHLQPLSLSFSFWHWPLGAVSPLWSSSSSSFCPAGGARRGDRGSWKETRRLPAKREKTPLCGKTERERQRERKRGIERGTEESHTSSLALRLTLGIGACGASSRVLGLFSYWTLTSAFLFEPHFLDPKSGPLDGQLSLSSDKLRMYLCVESCRYGTIAGLLCIFHITTCLNISGEKQLFYQSIFSS